MSITTDRMKTYEVEIVTEQKGEMIKFTNFYAT